MIQLIIYILFRKGAEEMAVIYATLIVKGKKTYSQVPERLKEQVKQVLVDIELEDLAK